MKGKILALIIILVVVVGGLYFYLSNAIRVYVRSVDFVGFKPLAGKVFVPKNPVVDVYVDVENPTPIEATINIKSIDIGVDGILVAKTTSPVTAKIKANALSTIKVRLEIVNTKKIIKTLFEAWILKKNKTASITVDGEIHAIFTIPFKITKEKKI